MTDEGESETHTNHYSIKETGSQVYEFAATHLAANSEPLNTQFVG